MSQPEELVLVARIFEDYISLGQKEIYGLRRGSKGHNISIQFHHGEKYWLVEDSYEDYELRARKEHDSFASYPFHGPTIDSAIEFVEKTYNVKIKIVDSTGQPVPMEEVRQRAQRMLEAAIAPGPKEITFFSVVTKNSEEVLSKMKEDLILFCRRAHVGDNPQEPVAEHGVNTCQQVLEGLTRNLDLEMENVDWDEYAGYSKLPSPRLGAGRELREILQRDRESAEYECERLWGVEPREKQRPGMSEGEKIGAALFEETMAAPMRQMYNQLASEDMRKQEAQLCKAAVKNFLTAYRLSMERRLPQLK